MTAHMKTYRMRMRIVRGAPYFDTVDADTVEVRATNAHDAEAEAARLMRERYPAARVAFAVSKRRV